MSQEPLTSPCISICQIDPISGECSGCYRTRSEIASWRSMSRDEQSQLLATLRDRRAEKTGLTRRKTRRQNR